MPVTVEELQEELHIDGEDGILKSLIEEGQEYVMGAVNYDAPLETYEEYPLFNRAVKTYATGYYYDRSTGIGANKGLMAMINVLRGRMWGGSNGKDSTPPA